MIGTIVMTQNAHKTKNAKKANVFFSTISQKNGNGNICILSHNLWINQGLDLLSTSKWPSEPQFCEMWSYSYQKMAGNGHKTAISDHFWPFFANCMVIFHKTEVQTVFLRGLTALNLNWSKSYDSKCKYFHFHFLSDFVKKTHLCYFCFCIFLHYVS